VSVAESITTRADGELFSRIKSISILNPKEKSKNMFRKYMSSWLILLLLNLTFYSAAAAADAKSERVKASVVRLGAGKNVKVAVTLRDGAKSKGYIGEIKDSDFVLIDEKTGTREEISYARVERVERQNLSKGEKIFVRSSLIIGALLLYGFLFSRSSDY